MAPTPEFLALLSQWELIPTHVKGTFANDSFQLRLPQLICEVAAQNKDHLTAKQHDDLLNLAKALQSNAKIPPLVTSSDEPVSQRDDTKHWLRYIANFDFSWQNAPWFLAETYMFRLVLQYSGYYETGIDPFHYSKLAELQEETPWRLLQEAVVASTSPSLSREQALRQLIKLCLWGNKADGCYKAVKDTVSGLGATLAVEDKYLLVDDSEKVIHHLTASGPFSSISFINDNCGTELLLDLALTDHLLTQKWCDSITLHVKAEPTYISDATPVDVLEHIQLLLTSPSTSPEMCALGERLKSFYDSKKLLIQGDLFWNSYAFFWELPTSIEHQLARDALVIVKGDANYRRLLGDRMWPATTPLSVAVPYFPAPFVSLRTLKSNPIVGLTATMEEALDKEEEKGKWRYNGKRGTIQGVFE